MRRRLAIPILLGGVAAASPSTAHAAARQDVPIIFVHGNGDDAMRWIPTIWLFESNGYQRDRLFAIRFHNPVARTNNAREEDSRSSTEEAREELSRFVQTVLQQTHSPKVVLVGSSRGGLTIRNYIQNSGAAYVLADVLCGTPNHGVNATDGNLDGEFNGRGTYLTGLNRRSPEGTETVRGVRTLTLRSDALDKFAQPTAVGLGHPEKPSGISYDGPALKGAQNVVLPGMDHRELAFSSGAFAEMYRFITGRAPGTTRPRLEPSPVVSGLITGFVGAVPTNDPLSSVHVRVSSERADGMPAKVYETTTTLAGAWGPVELRSDVGYAFDFERDGRHVTYFLPSLARSTTLLNFRFLPTPADAKGKGGLLILRPDGYFSRDRDPVQIDGVNAADEPTGLPIRDSFLAEVPNGTKFVHVCLRDEEMLATPSGDLSEYLPVAEFLR